MQHIETGERGKQVSVSIISSIIVNMSSDVHFKQQLPLTYLYEEGWMSTALT